MAKQSAPKVKEKVAEPVRTLEIVFPNLTNQYHTMFGGQVIALADKAAFFAANRYCRKNVVTASMERFDFREPIRTGDTIECVAKVVYAGRSSMVVRVDIFAEKPNSDLKVLCTSGYFTMVALGDDGKPSQVPQLKLKTSQDQIDWEEARKVRKAHAR